MRNQRIVHVDLVRPGVEYTAMEPNIKRGAHRIRKDNVTYVILSIKGLMDLEPHEWLVDDYGPGHLDATRKELEEFKCRGYQMAEGQSLTSTKPESR